ncbi:alpha/beta fold hydrolase [Salinarimonas soli]|uniref:Alpha/beta hydrolase n=1 Tax=Salinarimonas soli TaxID=1638099 RepID=A0A5B2VHA3_9HYPH|nr:alpha/beta hydrolase [Salinarimonas soli]KAA2238325.1 alpha/beta hydrolase [Salinarimonas soli]
MTSRRTTAALAAGAALAAVALWRRAQAKAAERANPPKGRFLRVDGVRLHVLERGDPAAPPVVILHGNGATIEDIESSGLLDALARDHRVIVLDRPGFGHTSRPRLTMWTARAQAALVADALRMLGVERPVVVGHSWGALTAAVLAVTRPEALGALVLLSGYFFPTPRTDVALFSLAAIPGPGDLFRYTVGPSLSAAFEPLLLHRIFEPQEVPAPFRREYPHPLAYRPIQIRAAAEDTAFMIPGAAEFAGRYHEIRVPTLIMAGGEDRIVTTGEQSAVMHRAIPGSTYRLLPGLGHMIHHFATPEIAEGIAALARGPRPHEAAPATAARRDAPSPAHAG